MDKKIISFPHLGSYHIPMTYFLTKMTDCEVIPAPPITKKTLELGAKHSPDFVCVPFKYNLGNFIEALEKGANILIQAGGGCRYGYYAEVQEQILKDLGYKFEFYSLIEEDKFTPFSIYKVLKRINKKLPFIRYIYYLCLSLRMIYYMDKIDVYIRANIGFEDEPNSFENLRLNMLNNLKNIKGFMHLRRTYKKYMKKFKRLKVTKPDDCLKIGVIGELYTAMEPFSSYYLEKMLAKMNIQVSRYTDLTYLLITKRFNLKKLLKTCGHYCKYQIGADGTDNVAVAKELIEKGYHGLIHTKPFGCTPEIAAMTILQKVSSDYNIPILFFSFDEHTSEEGIKTRLEAFYDMIKMRRNKIDKSLFRS